MKERLRRMTGLGILIGLMLLILVGAMAEGELPTDPNLEAVRQEERIANMILNGPIRGYTVSSTVVQLSQITAPTLGESGVWRVTCNHPDGYGVGSMIIDLMMKDHSDDYTMVYRKQGAVSTYTSCPIVSAGDYELTFFVTFTNGSQYCNNVLFTIEDDAAHTSLNERINEIVSAATAEAGNDVWAKALYLHDWLTLHAYYDGAYEYYGADGVLLRGYGVCDSYSKAYLLLCQAAEIPVSRVTGWAGENHAWNAIEIGGEWYHVDATWDDPYTGGTEAVSGYEHHNYFCLNDEMISLDHENDGVLFSTPCTSLEANWTMQNAGENWSQLGNYILTRSNGKVTGIGGTYSAKIQETLNTGDDCFTYPCDDYFYVVNMKESGGFKYYTYPSGDSNAIRGWTMLATKMSQTPFTVNGSSQTVQIRYDAENNWFTNCNHVWTDGSDIRLCTQCGAQICLHQHTSEEIEFTDLANVTISEIAGDNEHHRVSGTGNRTVTCDDCGKVLVSEENAEISVDEEHTYYNGMCTVTGCGHECTHNFDTNGMCSFCDRVSNSVCNVAYETGERMLRISGSGAVGINHILPWISQGYDIDRVMIDDGITLIGPNTFAELEDGVRIDFQQTVMPTISENAFSGTKAICRYTSNDSSWSTAPAISGVKWVWMPTFNTMAAGTFGPLWYAKDAETPGWSVEVMADHTTHTNMSAETAHEILLYCADLFLNAIPNLGELDTVISDLEDNYWYLYLVDGCTGELQLNGMNNVLCEYMPREILMSAPGMTLTVTDYLNNGNPTLEIQRGTLIYNGNAQKVILTNSGEEQPGNAVVNGTIGEVDYYSTASERPFCGTLTVTGEIQGGFVYGGGTLSMEIPGVTDSYPLSTSGASQTFGALTGLNNTVVIDTARTPAVAATLTDAEAPTADQFTKRYILDGVDNWLIMRPLAGAGIGSQAIELSIDAYNEDFMDDLTNNIMWGNDTEIHVSTTVTLTGKNGTGFRELSAGDGCNVRVICPVEQILFQPDPWSYGHVNMTIESTVRSVYLQPNNCILNITLQNGGSISSGRWKQLLRDYRNFSGITTGNGETLTLVQNSGLAVMSWTDSETLGSILPPDGAVGAAAGKEHAMATLTEGSVEDMNGEEILALDHIADGEEALSIGTEQILSVFDVSVNEYTLDEGGNPTLGDSVSSLGSKIPVVISGPEAANAFVVRLHREGNTVTATKLDVTDQGGGKKFESDLFSTYLLAIPGPDPFQMPEITIEYYLSDNSVLISLPWADGANYHEITVYKADGTRVYGSVWSEETPECMFHVNVMQGGQNRLLDAGEYYAEIVLKGAGYLDTTFRKDFTVFASLPDFAGFSLPEGTTTVEEEAFARTAATAAKIPDECTVIGNRAFDSSALKDVLIPASVTSIGTDAFPSRTRIFTPKGTYAQHWAKEHGYQVFLVIRDE